MGRKENCLAIGSEVRNVCSFKEGKKIKFKGQINIQCIDDKIIEINPRVGGASILSTYSGLNMPALSLALWQGKRVKKWYSYEDKILTRYFSSVCLNKTNLKRL